MLLFSEAIDEAYENLWNEVRYCAIKEDTNIEGIVTYDGLITEVNTIDDVVWMDPETGIFEARMDGVFRAYIGLEMSWEKDQHHTITVMVNDEVQNMIFLFTHFVDGHTYIKMNIRWKYCSIIASLFRSSQWQLRTAGFPTLTKSLRAGVGSFFL